MLNVAPSRWSRMARIFGSFATAALIVAVATGLYGPVAEARCPDWSRISSSTTTRRIRRGQRFHSPRHDKLQHAGRAGGRNAASLQIGGIESQALGGWTPVRRMGGRSTAFWLRLDGADEAWAYNSHHDPLFSTTS
ncbi:MAG: hypothetical protein IPM02_28060 [Betaproteobacteria bacterium]|nr:hypothetical protein [Betaproteobacteria bacterium]